MSRRDPITQRAITQITNYRGHSHHITGGRACWLEDGRRLVILSDREGFGNLFAYDFGNGTLSQLTDLRGRDRPQRVCVLSGLQLGLWYDAAFFTLELTTLRMTRAAGQPPERARPTRAGSSRAGEIVLADGRRAVWVGVGTGAARERRVVAVSTGTGREPFAATAPCLSPDAKSILFASDAGGYTQVFMVEMGWAETLPRLEDLI